jgi:hypothetical protein
MEPGLLPDNAAIEGFIKSIAGTLMPRNKPQWKVWIFPDAD